MVGTLCLINVQAYVRFSDFCRQVKGPVRVSKLDDFLILFSISVQPTVDRNFLKTSRVPRTGFFLYLSFLSTEPWLYSGGHMGMLVRVSHQTVHTAFPCEESLTRVSR